MPKDANCDTSQPVNFFFFKKKNDEKEEDTVLKILKIGPSVDLVWLKGRTVQTFEGNKYYFLVFFRICSFRLI